jgi:hypothetical protein
MKWMIRRVFVIWLTLCMLCTAAIALGYLDHRPNALQRLGFDVCDGDPCFRGVKAGMEWEKTTALAPESVGGGYFFYMNLGEEKFLGITASEDLDHVKYISFSPLKFNTAGFISLYGSPCRVSPIYWDNAPVEMMLIYPMMQVLILTERSARDAPHPKFRLDLTSQVSMFVITERDKGDFGTCNDPTNDDFGPWRGFTSVEIYRERNLRELGMIEPTVIP